jgi:hypothetical protein
VRSTSTAAGAGEGAFTISVRDDDVNAALACDNAAIGGAAVIQQTLPAGTYYVGIAGNNATTADTNLQRGEYRIQFENTALTGAAATQVACSSSATELDVVAGRPYQLVVKGLSSGDASAFKVNIELLATTT